MASLDPIALCKVFEGSLSPDPATRKEAEARLSEIKLTPGLLTTLVAILPDAQVSEGVRSSAAIFFKNEVRRYWDPIQQDSSAPEGWRPSDKGYSAEEKDRVRGVLLPLLACVMDGSPTVRNSVEEAIRMIVLSDFPEKWPTLLSEIVASLQYRMKLNTVHAALLVLRRVTRKYELRISSGREAINEIIAKTFPLLLSLAVDLSKANCYAEAGSSNVLKLVCKIYWSATQMALAESPEVAESLDHWMELLEFVIRSPVPEEIFAKCLDSEQRNALPQYKAKKWALQILHRLFVRYGTKARLEKKGAKVDAEIEQRFMSNWVNKFGDLFVEMLKASSGDKPQLWISDRMTSLIFQYLSISVELAATYLHLKPHIEMLLYQVCFPLLCYNDEDALNWQEDPVEFVRSKSDFITCRPRDSACGFVQAVTRLRGRDFLEPIMQFVQRVLVEHQNATPEEKLAGKNRLKDGALCLIGTVACRLTSKKRQLEMEPFLIQFVLPELSNSTDPFLRLRACWTYRQIFNPDRSTKIQPLKQLDKLKEAFMLVAERCADPELPVKSEAAVALRVFFEIEEKELRDVIASSLPTIMERLVSVMAQIPDNELVVQTIESLVLHFEEHIPPFAVDLVRYLASAFLRMLEAQQEESEEGAGSPTSVASNDFSDADFSLTAMSVSQAICSVLSTLTEPKFAPVYETIAVELQPLLDRLISPDQIEFLEDGLMMLTYITFHVPNLSRPVDLWRSYERMYQAVCGGTSSHLKLTGVCEGGWAPDYLDKMIPPLDNFLAKDMERFSTGVSSIDGKSFKCLLMEMAAKTQLELSDNEGPKSSFELLCSLFESSIGKAPAIDDMVAPCLKMILDFIAAFESSAVVFHKLVRQQIAYNLHAMILYNASHFLALVNSAADQPLAKLIVFAATELKDVKSTEGKRIGLLALCKLLEFPYGARAAQGTPELTAEQTTLVSQTVGHQTKAFIELKRKKALARAGSDGDDSDADSDDSEQDLDQHDDAKTDLTPSLMDKIRAAADEEDDDYEDEDDDESFGDEDDDEDGDLVKTSPLDGVDELDVIKATLERAEVCFVGALGRDDTLALGQFLQAELDTRTATVKA